MRDLEESKAMAWNAMKGICAEASKECPSKGKRVEITRGRKHFGKVGEVFWHGIDKYSPAGRYDGNAFQATMRVARGRYGFRIGVLTDEGERFFCPADYAKILQKGQYNELQRSYSNVFDAYLCFTWLGVFRRLNLFDRERIVQ